MSIRRICRSRKKKKKNNDRGRHRQRNHRAGFETISFDSLVGIKNIPSVGRGILTRDYDELRFNVSQFLTRLQFSVSMFRVVSGLRPAINPDLSGSEPVNVDVRIIPIMLREKSSNTDMPDRSTLARTHIDTVTFKIPSVMTGVLVLLDISNRTWRLSHARRENLGITALHAATVTAKCEHY